MIYLDFRCPKCDAVYEALVPSGTRETPCRKCLPGVAKALPSAPRIAYLRMGVDPDFTTAADKWATAHEKQKVLESKKADS